MIRRLPWLLPGSLIACVCACGGAPVPHDQLSAAQAAVRAAVVGGAPANAQASLHLKRANDQIIQAKALIEEDDNEKAANLLLRAEADADTALTMAQEQDARTKAKKAQQEVQAMRAEMQQDAPK
jgi:hypothetical protein